MRNFRGGSENFSGGGLKKKFFLGGGVEKFQGGLLLFRGGLIFSVEVTFFGRGWQFFGEPS